MKRRLNIRWRLTLWFAAAMTTLLVGRSFWIYFMMERRLTTLADVELDAKLDSFRDVINTATDRSDLQNAWEQFSVHQRELQIEVRDADQNLLFRSPARLPSPAESQATLTTADSGERHRATVLSEDGDQRRQVTGVVSSPIGKIVVDISRSMQSEKGEAWDFAQTLLTTLPLIIVAAFGVGYLVSSRALTPVDKMISTARDITANRLDQRIDVPDTGDELARLARTLNEMIDRLNKSFEEMRRFTADAAHDLRTPVTALRTEVEVSLMADRSVEDYRNSMETVLEEAVNLSRLTEQLLDLSREDHDMHSGSYEVVQLDVILRGVLENLYSPAQQKGIKIDPSAIQPWLVKGDPVRLRRVFMNLLNNAIQYTPVNGRIWIAGQVSSDRVVVEIADNGPGVPESDLPHIFDRFRRVDLARNRQSGGTGLGLAICKSIVESHGGNIQMKSTLGQGTRVIVELPVATATLGKQSH